MAKNNGQSFASAFAETRGVKETSSVTVVSEGKKHTFKLGVYVQDAERETVADAVVLTGGDISVSTPKVTGSTGLEVKRSKTFSAETLKGFLLNDTGE